MSPFRFRGEAVFVALLLIARPVTAADLTPPTKLETLAQPAVVKITHLQKLIATPLSGLCNTALPDSLVGAVAITRQAGNRLDDVVAGRIEFEAKADGPIVVAACYQYDGRITSSFSQQIWKEEKFAETGWKFVTELSLYDSIEPKYAKHKFYIRECRAGEKFVIRSRK